MKIPKLAMVVLSVALLAAMFITAGAACERNDYVVYEVTGNADSVSINLTNEGGASMEFNEVTLPFRSEFGGFEYSQPYLYAHNNTEDASTITANIYLNGKLFKTGTSYSPYCTVVVYGDK